MGENYKEDSPCSDCPVTCDHWESRFCCALCRYTYGEDTPCDTCDPGDI